MKRRSLLRQATIAVLAIEMACAIGLASAALWHEREVRWRALDTLLRGRSDSLIGAVQDAEDPDDNVKVDPEEFSPMPEEEFAVYNPDGRLLGATQGSRTAVALQAHDGLRNIDADGHSYRVLQRHALRIIDREETNGIGLRRPVTVVYAVRTDRLWHQVLEATRFYVLLSLAMAAVTGVLLVCGARRLLRPIRDLASSAAAIESTSLDFAAPHSALEVNELRPLAEALAQMMARVRRAFEAERRFMNDAAHELKTAAAIVRSTIQVLTMRSRSEEEYRGGLERALQDNERVEELVARMLTLARFDENGSSGAGIVDLREQAESALAALTTYAELRGVSLRLLEGKAANVRLSYEAAQSLLLNLLTNAIEHSARGSEVCVRLHDDEHDPSQVNLVVEDAGSGIAPEHLAHVFERFFREDPSRSRETGGAGLGLSICKSIVDSAGGRISIESTVGKGTRVVVQLKRHQG